MSLIALLLAASASMAAAAPAPGDLSLERIMADPDWIGAAPESPAWSSDGGSVLFERKVPGCDERDLFMRDVPAGAERLLGDDRRGLARPWSGILSRDERLHAFLSRGDVMVETLATGVARPVTKTSESERQLTFLSDGRIAYLRGDDWFAADPQAGLESPLVLLRAEDPPGAVAEKEAGFLRHQQERLFDSVRERRLREDAAAQRDLERRSADPSLAPAPWRLGKDRPIRQSALSPSGRWLLVVTGGKSDADWPQGIMAAHVTASGDTETRPVRAKVGTGVIESPRLTLLDLVTRQEQVLAFDSLPGITDDSLAALRERAAAAARPASDGKAREPAARDSSRGKSERALSVGEIAWNREGSRALVMLFSADNKDRWMALVEPSAPRLKSVHRLTDPAWVSWDGNEMGWLPSGDAFWYLSEESGWAQLYVRRVGDARARALTTGNFVVRDVVSTRDGRFLYFVANPGDPGTWEVHRVEVATGRREAVTALGGLNAFELSPDETRLLVTHSRSAHPPELVLADSAPGGHSLTLTHSTSAAFDAMDWQAPRLVDVPSLHGAGRIHARLYLPSGAAPPSGRSAVIFIHGAGYLQEAHEGWSGYFREFMFANLLAREGHVVLAPDYRASAGYGRAWRTAIHRDMGSPELEDLDDCIHWLVSTRGVDASRVGAWGGSYGGFLVLMAMFKRPELLACGAALRPVTDWAHYNHPYTSNILETPDLAPEAYRRSSPIEWAAGLKRPLLICAPMQDDNVLFQDTVRLAQRLIELERPSFEVALYPVEPHGFVRASSWLDEYRRIHRLLTANLPPAR